MVKNKISLSDHILYIFFFVNNDYILCAPAPGAVGHLSFTEILDTSLKVSWSEPNEKNGVLTGTMSPVRHFCGFAAVRLHIYKNS